MTPRKGLSFGEPPRGDHLLVFVIRDKDSTLSGGVLEVDSIGRLFRKDIHRPDDVPASIDQGADQRPAYVRVCVKREAAGHSVLVA